jgi:capsular polysaccharide export protein
MTASADLPLLRIPPFPNAARQTLANPGPHRGTTLSDAEVDRLATALADTRVGGTYWASQPAIPPQRYALVRVANPQARAVAIAGVRGARPILSWLELAPEMTSGGPPALDVVSGSVDPWHLLSGADEVIVDSNDELALLASLAGVPVTCVGGGRFEALGRGGADARREAFRRQVDDGLRFANPFTREDMDPTAAIELCAYWRKLIDSNRGTTAAIGFAFWKRPTVAPLLWAGTGDVPFVSKLTAAAAGERIAVWKTRTDPATMAKLEDGDAQLIEVEDGFIRSTGLGANCVPPLSIIVDHLGVYFDPSRSSDLERLIEEGNSAPDVLDRARQLRELIVELGVSKYGMGRSRLERRVPGMRHLLVPGQVEDDRSVMCGGGAIRTNLQLLQKVRDNNPDAYIIYKPHPDVEAGHRKGAIPDGLCLTLAQEIVTAESISSLIELADEVHVNTSLAGFEALLRNTAVTTYGVPFYAGWGLTRDLGPIPDRRMARRTLDELVAAALLLYPRYLDPATGLPCPPEILVRRLSEGDSQRNGPMVMLRRLQGRVNRAASRVWSR